MSTSPSDAGRSLLQNSIYVGISIENILYGMELILYFKSMQSLLSHGGVRRRSNLSYALFSSATVFMITVWVATSAIFGEKMWLIDSNYPGGLNAYFKANISDWYLDWGTTSLIILQLMTDALMIHRCRTIWNNYRIIVVPIFLWLSTLVLGILVDWTSSLPGGNFFVGISSQLALAYYSVSVFLNTMLTCIICYRIVRHGKFVGKNLGRQYASVYFDAITLVIESVLPYTLSGIAFLVSLGVGSPLSAAFLPVYVLMMSISPQMLILRVAAGRAWNNNISTLPVSTIRFSPSGPPDSVTDANETTPRDNLSVKLQTLSHLPDEYGNMVISPV